MEYASKATGDAGLTTGILGTALGALNSGLFNGGLGGLFGGGNAAADLSGMAAGAALAAALGAGGRCSEDKPVSRYELGLVQENAIIKAQADVYGAGCRQFIYPHHAKLIVGDSERLNT